MIGKYVKIIALLAICVGFCNCGNSGNGKDVVSQQAIQEINDTLDTFQKYKSHWDALTDSLKISAKNGDAEALYKLGIDHVLELVFKDSVIYQSWGIDSIALDYIERAAKKNYPDALRYLAEFYYKGRAADELKKRFESVIVPLAESGNAKAQYRYAVYLYNNDNSSQKAREYAKKSALQNDPEGQNFYANVGPSEESDFWFEKAAENGDIYSIYRSGKKQEDACNYAEALKCYRKVCYDEGMINPDLLFALADMYYKGRGVVRNYDVAISWYKYIATFTEHCAGKDAAMRLSSCYRFGRE